MTKCPPAKLPPVKLLQMRNCHINIYKTWRHVLTCAPLGEVWVSKLAPKTQQWTTCWDPIGTKTIPNQNMAPCFDLCLYWDQNGIPNQNMAPCLEFVLCWGRSGLPNWRPRRSLPAGTQLGPKWDPDCMDPRIQFDSDAV